MKEKAITAKEFFKVIYEKIEEQINEQVDKLERPKDNALMGNDAARYAYYESEQRGLKSALVIIKDVLSFEED